MYSFMSTSVDSSSRLVLPVSTDTKFVKRQTCVLAFPFAFSGVCLLVLLLLLLLRMSRCGFVTGAPLPWVLRWIGVSAAALDSKAQGPYLGERLAGASARARPTPAACSAS